nr:EOG090X0BDJ [Eulimnadia texana]
MSKTESRKIRRPALHKGWQNLSGKNAQSKAQLIQQLGETVDLSKSEIRSSKTKKPLQESSRGVGVQSLPSRQTAPIFKQPVTIKTSQETQCKSSGKQGNQEKPRQLFWEKRLERDVIRSTDTLLESDQSLKELFKPIGPGISLNSAIQSLISSLHSTSAGISITGQTGAKSALEKNPGVFVNPDQPLVQTIMITEEDIRQQEERVNAVRQKLWEALRGL